MQFLDMFPKIDPSTTVGELLACTESATYFWQEESIKLAEAHLHAQVDHAPTNEQQRLVSYLASYLDECKSYAQRAGVAFLAEFRTWESKPF